MIEAPITINIGNLCNGTIIDAFEICRPGTTMMLLCLAVLFAVAWAGSCL